MYTFCRLCGGPGTSGDGPGAPCRRCVRAVVASVVELVPVGSRASALDNAPDRAPDLDHGRSGAPYQCAREPLGLTIVERTLVRLAMSLPGRASDIALAGALPMLALEIAIRVAGRVTVERLRASQTRRRSRDDLWAGLIALEQGAG